jgi:hypothetical protein
MVEAQLPAHKIAELLGTSAENVWYAWAKVTDRSVWTLRQIATLFGLPGGQLPTLAQANMTDMRVAEELSDDKGT